MLILFISSAIALAIAAVIFNFGDDILWFFKSLKYFNQGIKVRYYPIVGYMKYADSPGAEDGLEKWQRLFRKDEDSSKSESVILTNGAGSIPLLYVNDMELLRDYFKRDSEITCPCNLEKLPFQESYIFGYGKKVMEDRAIFSEIFYRENLSKLTSPILGIIKRHINAIKKRLNEVKPEDGQQYGELEIKGDIQSIFRDVVTFVLFGGDVPMVEGLSIIDQIENMIVGYFKYNTGNLAHRLTGGLSSKLGLNAEFNRLERIHDKIKTIIKDIYNNRKNSKEYVKRLNVIDLLIDHNNKMEAENGRVLTIEQIVSNIIVMIFAGVDTSKNVTRNCTVELANNPDIQSDLRAAARAQIFSKEGGSEDYDAYVELEILDNFVTEALRLYTPAWINFLHLVKKDFKMGKYKISKGTAIRISFITLQSKPEYFENPRKFDLKKYEDKAAMKEFKRYAIIPFSAGKRPCPGKNLAQLVIKMIVSNLVNELELIATDKPNRRMIEMNYTIEHCRFGLRPVNNF